MDTTAAVLRGTTGPAFFLLIVIGALLSGCATAPASLAGDHFSPITPRDAAAGNANGKEIRWGGEIFAVEPGADRTCFAVLSRALLNDARPKKRGSADGVFIACRPGFLDPALYPEGSDITVVGVVSGNEQYQSGYNNFELAKVDATEIYLWPEYRWDTYAGFNWRPFLDSCAYAWDYYCLGSGYYANLARYCPYGHHHHRSHSPSHPANTAGYGRIAATINRIAQGAYGQNAAGGRQSAGSVRSSYVAVGPRAGTGGQNGLRFAANGGRSQFAGSGAHSSAGGRASTGGSSGSSGGGGGTVASSSAGASSGGAGGRGAWH